VLSIHQKELWKCWGCTLSIKKIWYLFVLLMSQCISTKLDHLNYNNLKSNCWHPYMHQITLVVKLLMYGKIRLHSVKWGEQASSPVKDLRRQYFIALWSVGMPGVKGQWKMHLEQRRNDA
jgi:hypothetical protein